MSKAKEYMGISYKSVCMPHAVFVCIHVHMSLSSATVCNFDDTILATYTAMELDLG